MKEIEMQEIQEQIMENMMDIMTNTSYAPHERMKAADILMSMMVNFGTDPFSGLMDKLHE